MQPATGGYEYRFHDSAGNPWTPGVYIFTLQIEVASEGWIVEQDINLSSIQCTDVTISYESNQETKLHILQLNNVWSHNEIEWDHFAFTDYQDYCQVDTYSVMCTDKDGLRKEIFGDGTVSSVDDAGNACDKFTYNLDANTRSISFSHSSFTVANDVGEYTFVIKGYKTGQGDSRFR